MARGRRRKEKPTEPEGTTGPIFREVEAPVDAGEMLATFKRFADEEQTVDTLTAELTRQRQQLGQAKKEREAAKRNALHLARTGKGLARVECIEVMDEARGVVRLVRKDAPEVEVDVRTLTAGEIQALSVARPAEVKAILSEVAERSGAFDFGDNEPAPPPAHPADVATLAEAVQH